MRRPVTSLAHVVAGIVAAGIVAAPVVAQPAPPMVSVPGVDYSTTPGLPPVSVSPAPSAATALPPIPPASTVPWDNRPVMAQVDPQARADWISECRRRTAVRDDWRDDDWYYGRRKHKRDRNAPPPQEMGRDTCEAYLDDWFAWHEQYARSWQSYWMAQQANVRSATCQCGEEVIEEYEEVVVPVRRPAPRRAPPVRDKRVRVN